MKSCVRASLLFAAAGLMGFAALVNAFVGVPHLQEDLIEVHVRPTLLRAVSVGMQFGAYAMFAFTLIVLHAATRAARGEATARLPLAFIAILYAAFGITVFLAMGSPHAFGYALAGLAVGIAAAAPEP
jgi:hypothetical protein